MRDVSIVSFNVLVATAQLLLAVILLARRRRPEWAWPLAGIFAANAGHAILSAVIRHYEATWSMWINLTLDLTIFLFFVHLALSFPERPRLLRNPWALPSLLILVAAILTSLHIWMGEALFLPRTFVSSVPQLLVGYVYPTAAWALLLGRWAWRWRAMPAAKRTTFQWLLAAFAMRAANVSRGGPLQ